MPELKIDRTLICNAPKTLILFETFCIVKILCRSTVKVDDKFSTLWFVDKTIKSGI